MRIFYDHQTFSEQNYGGISRYFCELITRIPPSDSQHSAHLSLLFSNNVHLREYGLPARPFFPTWPVHRVQPRLYAINRAWSIWEMRKRSFDLYHATYYDPYFFRYLRRQPVVVTVHDLIHERLSERFSDLATDQRMLPWKREIISRASAIIAISEHTRQDLIDVYQLPPDRIRVIYHGTSLTADPLQPEPSPHPPYLLFVGNRGHYKNFSAFIRAAAPVLRSHQLRVICAGGGAFKPDELLLLRELNLRSLVEQQPIDDLKLRQLYRQAVAFVFPSLYEGFGLPVLEAFAGNCPCLLSNRSSLPEVAGSAALYFDPENPDSMREAVEKIVNDPDFRQQLIQRGRQQLQGFSWEKTVQQTLTLYQDLL
ncbi:glycosyltransferase family 4 protein [Larkinella bovis]|uniref:Glycosyltransferase family 4 protein n=1 Tax=Larkinella bovis TaxID=683041 RepID=A0ABW0IHK6_9BACT